MTQAKPLRFAKAILKLREMLEEERQKYQAGTDTYFGKTKEEQDKMFQQFYEDIQEDIEYLESKRS